MKYKLKYYFPNIEKYQGTAMLYKETIKILIHFCNTRINVNNIGIDNLIELNYVIRDLWFFLDANNKTIDEQIYGNLLLIEENCTHLYHKGEFLNEYSKEYYLGEDIHKKNINDCLNKLKEINEIISEVIDLEENSRQGERE